MEGSMSLNSRDQGSLGKYRVIAELGHGGMADVFLAVVRGPVGFNKLVVIKQLRQHLAEVPDFLDMFLDEARLAARLNHPNVVQTNEVVEEGNRYFIAMEYLDGQSFDRVLRRGQKEKKLLLLHMLRVLCEALEGLHYAHELCDFDGTPLQVVHRDVTPHNIFVTYEGQVKVVDFGIAKAANCSAETRTGVLKGKISYMAPEQARGDSLDRRADLFSVGLMLWEIVVGARPWKGLSDIQILGRLATGQIPTPRSANPAVDPELERICLKATSPDPSARYATAAEMREDIERFVEAASLRCSPRELGGVVADLFQDRRAEIRSLIDVQLRDARSLPTGEYQAARTSLVDLSTATTSVSLSSSRLPVVRNDEDQESSSPSHHTPVQPSSSSRVMMAALTSEPSSPPPKRSPWGAILGVIAVLVVAGGFFLRSNTSSEASSQTPHEAPTAALCEVKIVASPTESKIFLDDAPLATNPFSSRFPRDGAAHRVRVEAPGHATKTELISFDQPEISIEIALLADAVAAVSSAPAEPSAPAEATKTTSRQNLGVRHVAVTATTTTTTTTPPNPPEPALTAPKKKNDKRQLDGDDPWAK